MGSEASTDDNYANFVEYEPCDPPLRSERSYLARLRFKLRSDGQFCFHNSLVLRRDSRYDGNLRARPRILHINPMLLVSVVEQETKNYWAVPTTGVDDCTSRTSLHDPVHRYKMSQKALQR